MITNDLLRADNQSGMSLIEVVMGVVILLMVLIPASMALNAGTALQFVNQFSTTAQNLAVRYLGEIDQLSPSSVPIGPVQGLINNNFVATPQAAWLLKNLNTVPCSNYPNPLLTAPFACVEKEGGMSYYILQNNELAPIPSDNYFSSSSSSTCDGLDFAQLLVVPACNGGSSNTPPAIGIRTKVMVYYITNGNVVNNTSRTGFITIPLSAFSMGSDGYLIIHGLPDNAVVYVYSPSSSSPCSVGFIGNNTNCYATEAITYNTGSNSGSYMAVVTNLAAALGGYCNGGSGYGTTSGGGTVWDISGSVDGSVTVMSGAGVLYSPWCGS
ncbi:MAG: hypothetical protein M1483_00645 [Actinobacteria bacterium]|nr:hypothetical protein [Actinomycetota bacterium]MCL6104142.1 hypothetical protein [Actinomycetota bacterium]